MSVQPSGCSVRGLAVVSGRECDRIRNSPLQALMTLRTGPQLPTRRRPEEPAPSSSPTSTNAPDRSTEFRFVVSDDEQDAPIRGLAPTIITRPVASLGLVTAAPYGEIVKTVIHGPLPPELEQVIERRRALGQDRLDEVWDGS